MTCILKTELYAYILKDEPFLEFFSSIWANKYEIFLEKKKKLFVYEPKEYGEDEHPTLQDLGNGHWLYGTQEEIDEAKKIRFGEG